MAKTVEQMQDTALRQMDKSNRRNRDDRREENMSLADQLKAAKKRDSMSNEEKLRTMEYAEWVLLVKRFVDSDKKYPVSSGCFTWVCNRKKGKLEEFHKMGSPLKEVKSWIDSLQSEYMNL